MGRGVIQEDADGNIEQYQPEWQPIICSRESFIRDPVRKNT